MRQWFPEQLRRHKFKKSLPAAVQLPETDDEYREIEAWKFFGGGSWTEWRHQPAHERAKLMAWFIVHTHREAYEHEMREKHPKGEKEGFDPSDDMLRRFGLR